MSNYSEFQIELKAHIDEYNLKLVEKGSKDFLVTNDLDHWAESDVFTVEQFEHYMAIELYVDLYKDLNGSKPRHMDFDLFSTDEIYAMVDKLVVSSHVSNLAG
jgi:hypothetical protein